MSPDPVKEEDFKCLVSPYGAGRCEWRVKSTHVSGCQVVISLTYRSVSFRHQLGNVSMSRCNCCSVTRDSLSYVLSQPTPGKFNDCPSKRFSQTVSFCLLVAGGYQTPLLLSLGGPPKDKSMCSKPELSGHPPRVVLGYVQIHQRKYNQDI